MPQAEETKKKSNTRITKNYKTVSVIFSVALVLATLVGVFISSEGLYVVRDFIYTSAFVLSFAFLILYYIDLNKENILKDNLANVIVCVIPALSLFMLHSMDELIGVCVIAVFLVFYSGIINFTLSGMILVMLYFYSLLFPQYSINLDILDIMLILALCLFARSIYKAVNLIYSLLIITLFYLIVLLITGDFDFNNVLSIDHVIRYITGIAALILMYFVLYYIKKSAVKGSGFVVSRNDNMISTDMEASSDLFIFENDTSAQDTKKLMDSLVPEEDLLKIEDRLKRVYKENDDLREEISKLSSERKILTEKDICSEDFMFLTRLKLVNPTSYKHSLIVAGIAGQAARMIKCDYDTAYALGILHESAKVLGKDYDEILENKYRVPEYFLRSVRQFSKKSVDMPVSREVGIVMLINDIIHTYDFVTKKLNSSEKIPKDMDFSWAGIVRNTIKVRNDQKMLRYSGFSAEEVNILKDFFIGAFDDFERSLKNEADS